MGLSISKSLIELMKGNVGVTSSLGKGSCFWFEIELTRVAFKQEMKSESKLAQNSFENVKALVVDDNAVNLKLAKLSLEKNGVEVNTLLSCVEALSYLQENTPDLIFMDYLMPEMDGLETTVEIRKIKTCKEIPIIALTANAMKEDREKCIEAGMSGFISKPFTKQDIQNVLLEWFGN